MKKLDILLLSTFLGTALSSSAAVATFTDSFTTGYTDDSSPAGINGWLLTALPATDPEADMTTTDVNGDGYLSIVPATQNFQKIYKSASDSFEIGQTITISTTFSFGNANAASFDANAWSIGFSGGAGGGINLGFNLGSSANALGATPTPSGDGTGTQWNMSLINGASTVNYFGTRDTNSHTASMSITKTATTNEFVVALFFDGNAVGNTSTITNSALYNDSTVFFTGSAGGGGVNAVGGVAVDSMSVVPEPSSVALLGLGALGLFARRRR
ncbi:PEP-CTERM sorting domain-containing protein [Luteolibacter algae]|uniref:PEP-CTERM sorting domain-containing protein n=1 Tax=Luteolibacter algae TaxID=454151 RepID=A0ABW5D3Z3_9BACT